MRDYINIYRNWPKIGKYAFWIGVGALILSPASFSTPTTPTSLGEKIFASFVWPLFLAFGVWFFAGVIRRGKATGMQKQLVRNFSSNVHSSLAHFSPNAQWTQVYRAHDIALAFDSSSYTLCVLWPNVALNRIEIQSFQPKDIINAEIFEDGHTVTRSTSGQQTKTSGVSMATRTVVGGVLLGPVGAIVGGATAKEKTKGTSSSTTKEIVSRLDLYLTVADSAKPLYIRPLA